MLTIHAPTANAEVTELRLHANWNLVFTLTRNADKNYSRNTRRLPDSARRQRICRFRWPGQNEALLSGSIQIASGGVPPFAVFWARTRGTNNEVKAITAKNCAPIMLLTRDPRIKSIRDFTEQDKIAMPTKVSGQAIILQMATQKEYGKGNEFKFDNLQVAMPTQMRPSLCYPEAARSTIISQRRHSSIKNLKSPGSACS